MERTETSSVSLVVTQKLLGLNLLSAVITASATSQKPDFRVGLQYKRKQIHLKILVKEDVVFYSFYRFIKVLTSWDRI